MAGPPLELGVVIDDGTGTTTRWDANASDPRQRPLAIKFGTRLMEGFGACTCSVVRQDRERLDDAPEYATLKLVGIDGTIAYEGRVAPRADDFGGEVGEVGIVAGSWMNHARDKPLAPYVYIDRSYERWGALSTKYRIIHDQAGYSLNDPTVEGETIQTALPDPTWTMKPISFAKYLAPPGALIGKFTGAWARGVEAIHGAPQYTWQAYLGIDETFPVGSDASGELRSAGPGAFIVNAGGSRVAAGLRLAYEGTYGADDNADRSINWSNLAVYGPHSLQTDATTGYLRASDVLRHSASLGAPLLDSTRLTESESFEVANCVIAEPTDPYDLWLDLNRYDLGNIAVWENRRLTNDPLPSVTSEPNWRVRTDDNGVRVRWAARHQGYNGCYVCFQNVATLRDEIRDPSSDSRLADTDPNIAANQVGIDQWTVVSLPDPTTPELAVRKAAQILKAYNAQRQPAKLTVTGYVKTAGGSVAQAWRVRAGDLVLIENEQDARPRLVVETTYDAATATLVATLDRDPQDLDAIVSDALAR